jgi:uncharacterized RDD family membrane protein YckC
MSTSTNSTDPAPLYVSDAMDDTMPGPETPPRHDPRDAVTAYAFEVDPALLGQELATPKRRLAALLIDLLLASALAALGGILVGFAVAYIFFRVATRREVQHPLKRWARGALALLGAFVLYITVVAVLGGGWTVPFMGSDEPTAPSQATAEQRADQDSVLRAVGERLQQEGVGFDDNERTGVPAPVVGFLDSVTPPPTGRPPDERAELLAVLQAYSEALAQQDSTRIDSLRPRAVAAVAGPQLRRLRQSLSQAEERTDDLADENDDLRERVESPSLWRLIRSTANDFGLRVGWVGVYFTLFLAWWDGLTPGKRLLGMRVVRLDGTPLTLWLSFERFGGYAAGIATGLLGFAQVYWDPNRQAIHDRIAHTVVIRMRGVSA